MKEQKKEVARIEKELKDSMSKIEALHSRLSGFSKTPDEFGAAADNYNQALAGYAVGSIDECELVSARDRKHKAEQTERERAVMVESLEEAIQGVKDNYGNLQRQHSRAVSNYYQACRDAVITKIRKDKNMIALVNAAYVFQRHCSGNCFFEGFLGGIFEDRNYQIADGENTIAALL